MAAARGKLNPRSGGSALGNESHHEQNPDRFRGRGFFFSPQWLLPYQSLRFASAMMMNLNRRMFKKVRIQMRADTCEPPL